MICVGAPCVASVGWATGVGLAAPSLVHAYRATLLVGATVVAGAFALAVAFGFVVLGPSVASASEERHLGQRRRDAI
jgi:hypothetical protein